MTQGNSVVIRGSGDLTHAKEMVASKDHQIAVQKTNMDFWRRHYCEAECASFQIDIDRRVGVLIAVRDHYQVAIDAFEAAIVSPLPDQLTNA